MPIKRFELQFPAEELRRYTEEYSYRRDPTKAAAAGEAALAAGRYTREGALDVIDWKAARAKVRLEPSEARIITATTMALGTNDEPARMDSLTTLDGVGVPIASALLFFVYPDRYPMLDMRTVRSLGHSPRGQYPTTYWVRYLGFCRDLANQQGLSIRELDKALWEYDHQQNQQGR